MTNFTSCLPKSCVEPSSCSSYSCLDMCPQVPKEVYGNAPAIIFYVGAAIAAATLLGSIIQRIIKCIQSNTQLNVSDSELAIVNSTPFKKQNLRLIIELIAAAIASSAAFAGTMLLFPSDETVPDWCCTRACSLLR